MGQNQSSSVATNSWTVDDWAFGTGANALSTEEVMQEASKLPSKLFGGKAIENDPSMHQMQNELLSIDQTLKNLFRRKKKNKRSREPVEQVEEYYPDQQYYDPSIPPQTGNDDYLQPIPIDQNQQSQEAPPSAPGYTEKLTWRCKMCTCENKISENVCRRCKQAETAL